MQQSERNMARDHTRIKKQEGIPYSKVQLMARAERWGTIVQESDIRLGQIGYNTAARQHAYEKVNSADS